MNLLQWDTTSSTSPGCGQLKIMGWQWLEDGTDVPELTDLLTSRVHVPEGTAVAP